MKINNTLFKFFSTKPSQHNLIYIIKDKHGQKQPSYKKTAGMGDLGKIGVSGWKVKEKKNNSQGNNYHINLYELHFYMLTHNPHDHRTHVVMIHYNIIYILVECSVQCECPFSSPLSISAVIPELLAA